MDIRSFFKGGGGKKKAKPKEAGGKNSVLNKVTPTKSKSKTPPKSKSTTPKRSHDDEEEDFESSKKAKKSPSSSVKKEKSPKTSSSATKPNPSSASKKPKGESKPTVVKSPTVQKQASPSKTKKAIHVAETDDEDDDEATALDLLGGDDGDDGNDHDEAMALAMLEDDDEVVPSSPKKRKPMSHQEDEEDESSSGNVNAALASARKKSPKKASSSPKKQKQSGTPNKLSLDQFSAKTSNKPNPNPNPKPSAASDDDDTTDGPKWNCSACTLLNPANLDSCVMCDNPRQKQKPKPKKKIKMDPELRKAIKPEPEKEKAETEQPKKNHKAAYFAMKNRTGPDALGSKTLPVGQPNCLHGLKFICTGVLDSITREQAEELVKRYGGSLTKSVTKKLDYVVLGREAGPKKLELIAQYGIKTLSEDEFFDFVGSKGAGPDNNEMMAEESKKVAVASKKTSKKTQAKAKTENRTTSSDGYTTSTPSASAAVCNGTPGQRLDGNSMLWSVKYAPTQANKIAGQQGAKSNMNKLKNWLSDWYVNQPRRANNVKKSTKASDDGWEHTCCLMAGPPGVGKTTTAHLVCKELGFAVIEMNASDCRNKKSLKEEVAMLLGNTTMTQFFGDKTTKKQALIMDEVDGMGGNADRGGMPELIALIKKTKIPIICMANDKDVTQK